MLNDPLANAMSIILNNERIGKSECSIKPSSSIMKETFRVMKENGFLEDFKEVEDTRGNYIQLVLNGSINKCGVIKPRYSCKNKEFEKFEKRYLPAKDMGIILVSTPKGIITHIEAKNKKTGGKLLAYCY